MTVSREQGHKERSIGGDHWADAGEVGRAMKKRIGFVVIYRWKLRAGMERSFREAWCEITEWIMKERGGLGSRLHRSAEGYWLAYAQWPSKEAWRKSRALGPAEGIAADRMNEAILESYEPILLYPEDDLLQ